MLVFYLFRLNSMLDASRLFITLKVDDINNDNQKNTYVIAFLFCKT